MELSSKQILAIKAPEMLFKETDIKQQYRELAMKWHPDKNPDKRSSDVMAHIGKLYTDGIELIAKGRWHVPGKLSVIALDGTKYNIKYKYRCGFELGVMYVGDTILAYSIAKDLFKSQRLTSVNTAISWFEFRSPDMKTEFSKYLPSIKKVIETKGEYIICLDKTADVLPLSVVLKYYDGFVPPEHVAWIMSSMQNILCYLQYSKIVHQAIDLNNYFISPTFHSGLLLGGWWYALRHGDKLRSVPTRTFNFMSKSAIEKKTAGYAIDDELVLATCRALLGDEIGTKLILDKRLDGSLRNMVTWMRTIRKSDRVKNYKQWKKEILVKSFGEIKFIPMDIDIDAAYEKAGGVM